MQIHKQFNPQTTELTFYKGCGQPLESENLVTSSF